MPYEIRKLPNKNQWRVYNKDTGKVFSKATTKAKAEGQMRLLYMLERKEAKSVGGRLIEKIKALDKACWEGYEAIGMKKKGNRKVPNCVPIKGGVLGMTDANGNPLPLDLQYKNNRINALNFSYNMLREQLIDLIEIQQNQDAIQELRDIQDGMNNLSTAMVRLEDNREGMPMADFKREVNRLTAILTRYVREANRWEGIPPPDEGESDVEGFGMGSSKITPTSPDELTKLVYASRPSLVFQSVKRKPTPSLEEQRSMSSIIAKNTAKKLANELDNKRFVPKDNWLSGGRIYKDGWVFIPMRQEIEGAGWLGFGKKVAPEPEPLAYYEQEGLARMRREEAERRHREIEEREARRIAEARAERIEKDNEFKEGREMKAEDRLSKKAEIIAVKRAEALAKARAVRAEKKRKEDALRLARQDSSKSVSSGTSED